MESVVCEVTVPLALESAFELFTAQFGRWWPRDYSYSREVLGAIVFGNGQGEWCFERGPHGFRCDWARIVEWNPPSQVSFTWQISPKSVPQPDPNKASLVNVRFVAKGAQETQVAVEHSHFERHGEGSVEYRGEMASAYGWPFVLEQYAGAARQG
jgi:uncharacterized protein YndB with AHSA1/START domain